MRINIALGLSFLFVASCAPTGIPVPYKPGASSSQGIADAEYCENAAYSLFPVKLVNRSIGGQTSPAYTSCSTSGGYTYCTTTGGQTTPITNFQADANRAKRADAAKECLIAKGYEIRWIPECTGDVIGTLQRLKVEEEESPYQRVLQKESCGIVSGQLVYVDY